MDYKPVFIAADIKYHPRVLKDAGASILRLDICWSLPVCGLNLSMPRPDSLFRLRLFLPELF
jgi:hypothetical protein